MTWERARRRKESRDRAGRNPGSWLRVRRETGKKRWWQSFACIGVGVILFLAAEAVDSSGSFVENGTLLRNPCGKGDAVYEFYVDGLGSEKGTSVTISVPEQKMTEEEFSAKVPEIVDVLCMQILGENVSLSEVRSDLELVREIPEFGVSVSWESEQPEIVSAFGAVDVSGFGNDSGDENGRTVYLEATLRHGAAEEIVEIPMTVYPPTETLEDRFLAMMEELVLLEPELGAVVLPTEFEGKRLTYRPLGKSQNAVLVLLGMVAAVCVFLKEKSDLDAERKRRENSLMEAYPDFVSEFLILTGAGYSAKAAWKKMTLEYGKTVAGVNLFGNEKMLGRKISGKHGRKQSRHPLYEEMQVAMNQMETGVPETRVYADFGRRCQLRCYVKFASLLESSVNTGGKNLRRLLEDEMEEAFKQRTDYAKRKGEELSSKLLLPMFGMLAVVMVIVVSPAFLSMM